MKIKWKKFCEKIETPFEKLRRIFFPFETCEVTATPLEILRSTAYVLAPP